MNALLFFLYGAAGVFSMLVNYSNVNEILFRNNRVQLLNNSCEADSLSVLQNVLKEHYYIPALSGALDNASDKVFAFASLSAFYYCSESYQYLYVIASLTQSQIEMIPELSAYNTDFNFFTIQMLLAHLSQFVLKEDFINLALYMYRKDLTMFSDSLNTLRVLYPGLQGSNYKVIGSDLRLIRKFLLKDRLELLSYLVRSEFKNLRRIFQLLDNSLNEIYDVRHFNMTIFELSFISPVRIN